MTESQVDITKLDLLDNTSSWLDEGMRVYFASGAVVYVLSEYLNISKQFSQLFGAGWNFVDAIGGYALGIQQLQQAGSAKRHKKEKYAEGVMNIGMSTKLIGLTSMTLFAQYGVIHGTAAAVFTPLAGFSFAAVMWGGLAMSSRNLHRARKKTNMAYLFYDRAVKLQNINKQLKALDNSYNAIADQTGDKIEKQKKKLEQKIKELSRVKLRMQKQALSLYRHCLYDTELIYELVKYEDKLNGENIHDLLGINESELNAALTGQEKKLVETLQSKKKKKVARESVAVLAWGLASVGMTLIALAPFFPPLLIPGIVIAAVAGAVKLGELIANQVVKRLASRSQMKKYTKQLHDEYKTKKMLKNVPHSILGMDSKPRPHDEKVRLRLAYELSRDELINSNPNSDEATIEEGFYKRLLQLPKGKLKKFLKAAEREMIKRTALNDLCAELDNASLSQQERDDLLLSKFWDKSKVDDLEPDPDGHLAPSPGTRAQ